MRIDLNERFPYFKKIKLLQTLDRIDLSLNMC